MKEIIFKSAGGGLPQSGKQSTYPILIIYLSIFFEEKKMEKKWICTIAEDIGCPERTVDGFVRLRPVGVPFEWKTKVRQNLSKNLDILEKKNGLKNI